MDDNLYDEFGNYIGPDLGGSSEDDSESEEEEEEEGEEDEEGENQGVGEVRAEGTQDFLFFVVGWQVIVCGVCGRRRRMRYGLCWTCGTSGVWQIALPCFAVVSK